MLSLYKIEVLDIFTFTLFLVMAFTAIYTRNSINLAFLLFAYFVLRFNLIEANGLFRYISDVVALFALFFLVREVALKRVFLRWFDYGFAVFAVIFLVISKLNGVPVLPALIQIRALFVIYPVYIYFREVGFPDFRSKAAHFDSYFKIIAWWLFLQAIIEKTTNKTILPTLYVQYNFIADTNYARVYGWASNPNSLGAIAILLMVLAVYLIMKNLSERKKLLTHVSLLAAILFLTVSRSAILSLIFLFGFLWMFRNIDAANITKAMKFLSGALGRGLVIAAVVIVAAMFIPKVLNIYFYGYTEEKTLKRLITFVQKKEIASSAVGGRLYNAKLALQISTESPKNFLIGTGLATFGGSGGQFWSPPSYKKHKLPPWFYSDLFYATLLVEMGILGLLLFMILLTFVFLSNQNLSWPVKGSIMAMFYFWCFFYNVVEIQSVYYLVLLFGATGLKTNSEQFIT